MIRKGVKIICFFHLPSCITIDYLGQTSICWDDLSSDSFIVQLRLKIIKFVDSTSKQGLDDFEISMANG